MTVIRPGGERAYAFDPNLCWGAAMIAAGACVVGAAKIFSGEFRDDEPREPRGAGGPTLPPIPRPQRPHVPPHRQTPPHEFDGKTVIQGKDQPSGRHPRTR